MPVPISSLPKSLCFYLGIALLFISFLTSCSGRPPVESSIPTFPPQDLPAPSPTTPPVFPLEETATPAVLEPRGTGTGIASPCPLEGGPVELSEVSFDDLPEAVTGFLNDGGSAGELQEALYQAGVANLPQPTASGDMDGDGWEEIVVSIYEPGSTSMPPAGMLLVFHCQEGAYQIAYQEDTRPTKGAPGIRFFQDLNGDGQSELLVSSASCGVHTCFERVQLIQWDGTGYSNLLEGETADLPYPTIYLSTTVQEGVFDIEVSGSGIGSVGAGPQRNVTRTWSYNQAEQLWQVSSFRHEPSNYRIHVLHDAASAAKRGDYQDALVLYHRVTNDTSLEDWTDPELEQAWIKAFASYQTAVIYTLLDRDAFASTVLEEMQNTTPPESPQYGYYEMAVAYIDGYLEGGTESGCQRAQDYAAMHPGLLASLGPESFGYGNPEITRQDLCP